MYVKDPVQVSVAIQGKSEHRGQRKIQGSITDGLQEKMVKCKDTYIAIYSNFRKVHSTDPGCRLCHGFITNTHIHTN